MLSDEELQKLLSDLESDRVERKSSASDRDKIRQAICAFANDLPGHGKPGLIFIGVNDDGSCAGTVITDDLLLNLSHMRETVTPFPSMTVQKRRMNECDIAVITVEPSEMPPVRYDGRTWIRVGPRRDKASPEEERRLIEKRRHSARPFDVQLVPGASINDLDIERFRREYLPQAVAPEIIARNSRSLEQQFAALGLATSDGEPTWAGILVLGKSPRSWLPGAYIQFTRIDGTSLADPIKDQKEISGCFLDLLRYLDEILTINISTALVVSGTNTDIKRPDYPLNALQQMARNAILHRNYDGTNAPVRIYWFSDRIEIHSPGGPFGQVTRENFGHAGITDYRNPHLADAMKVLGYVQRFGMGFELARAELKKNGSPPLEFDVQQSHTLITLRPAS
jgi:ATP-dependent DNA helicase RecG